MRILLAVVDDLFQFACTALFGVSRNNANTTVLRHHTYEIAPQLSLPTFSSVGEVLKERTEFSTEYILAEDVTYFVGEECVRLFYEPVIAFDGALQELSYGTPVRVIKRGGRWAQVDVESTRGWVLRDSLRKDASSVYPSLVHARVYTAEDQECIKLRYCIKDAFLGAETGMPLTDVEFVTYRLAKRGLHIPWTDERPRIAGVWQRILRGRERIHIGIVPKMGSVIEYTYEDEGHVGFVESVFPDDSIKISSVGLYTEGEYTETVLTKDVWKELRPVFIEQL